MYTCLLLVRLGAAMCETFLPLFARSLGASIVMIGLISAAEGFGAMLFYIPAGFLSGRFQQKP